MSSETFLQKLIFAYSPVLGPNKNDKKELKRILSRLKKNDKLLFDPIQLKLKPLFGSLVLEVNDISNQLKSIYAGNIESVEDDYMDFKRTLASSILEKDRLTLQSLEISHVLKTAHDQKLRGIVNLDNIFNSRIKSFSGNEFKKYKVYIIRNQIFNDLAQFDYSGIIDMIPMDKKNQTSSFLVAHILEKLKDLYYISSLIPDKSSVSKDPVFRIAFEANNLDSQFDLNILQTKIHRLIDIFKGPLSASFLKDIIILTSRNPQIEIKEKEYNTLFPKEVYDSIVEKYRIDRGKYIQLENEKRLESRMTSLFQDRELLTLEVYSEENSELFHGASLPSFQYIIPMKIIKSFIAFHFGPIILSSLRGIQTEAEFIEPEQKKEFQNSLDLFDSLIEKVKKFEDDLSVPSFSELLQYIEILQKSFMDNKTKNKAREAVKSVNTRADKLIQDTFHASISLQGYLTNITVDLDAKTSKLLYNATFLKHKKVDLCKGIEESAELFNKFIKLLKIFAVHVNAARKTISSSQ